MTNTLSYHLHWAKIHLLSHLIGSGRAPDCIPPACQVVYGGQPRTELSVLFRFTTAVPDKLTLFPFFFFFLAVARHCVFNHRRTVTSWYCYWPKVTHSPRFSKSVRAGTWERGECGRDAGAEVTVLFTHTWVWVARWALPCSTWPTPSCLCWWSRGQDHMASRYRPLLVHSGSAQAQCRGSTTQGYKCRQKVALVPCCFHPPRKQELSFHVTPPSKILL